MKISSIEKELEAYQQSFTKAVSTIQFDNRKNIELSKSYQDSLKSIDDRESRIKLKIEQSKLVDDNRTIESLMEQIKKLKSNRRDLVHKKLIYDFLIFLKFLHDRR